MLLAIVLPVSLLTHSHSYAKRLSSFIVGLGKQKGDKPKPVEATPDPVVSHLLTGTGWISSLCLGLYLWSKCIKVVGNPLEINLRKYQSSPDYESRTAFIENFHRDFRRIVDAYTNRDNPKVFVFIDDLDRSEPTKAADLMKAIAMLVAGDQRLIFVIGMDRRRVAAGLAIKYESLLPYLTPGYLQKETGQKAISIPNRFGHEFLEKFVQLPFVVPLANGECLKDYLEAIIDSRTKGASVGPKNALGDEPPGSDIIDTDHEETTRSEQRDAFRLLIERDTTSIKEITLLVADALHSNPRHIKQFINLFRLKFYIAISFWRRHRQLIDLMFVGCEEAKEPFDRVKYGLEKLKAQKVLSILPRRPPFVAGGKEDTATETVLVQLGREYEILRDSMPPGNERTERMNGFVAHVQKITSEDVSVGEIRKLFEQGSPGSRIVAIALLERQPDARCFDLILQSITEFKSPFEQYHALRVARTILPNLSSSDAANLLNGIRSQMNVSIPESDQSRWTIAQDLLEGYEPIPPPR